MGIQICIQMTLSLDARENMMSVRVFIGLVTVFAILSPCCECQQGALGPAGDQGPAGHDGPLGKSAGPSNGHGGRYRNPYGPPCPERRGECLDAYGAANIRNGWTTWQDKRDWNHRSRTAKQDCLDWCHRIPSATGCEIHWHMGSNGCIAHLVPLSRSNGISHHSCWIFSQCRGAYHSPNRYCRDDFAKCSRDWRTLCEQPRHREFMYKNCRRQCGLCW